MLILYPVTQLILLSAVSSLFIFFWCIHVAVDKITWRGKYFPVPFFLLSSAFSYEIYFLNPKWILFSFFQGSIHLTKLLTWRLEKSSLTISSEQLCSVLVVRPSFVFADIERKLIFYNQKTKKRGIIEAYLKTMQSVIVCGCFRFVYLC